MVVLLIVAIALGIGVPSFKSLIERTRTRTSMEDIVELLRLARLTAVEQLATVTVCASADGVSCSNSAADWNHKLIALRPDPDNGAGTEAVMNMSVGDGVTLSHNRTYSDADGAGGYTIDFQANGWTPGDQGSLFVCPDSGDDQYAYRIYIAMSGKIRAVPHDDDAGWTCTEA